MDKVINQLCEELERRFIDGDNADKVCNIGQWISYCEYRYDTSCFILITNQFVTR
jgi:hypothetical protein